MDRSHFTKVETNDYGNRVSIREALAKKVEAAGNSQPSSISVEPFTVGTKVSHPQLGNGVIKSFSPDINEIIIDFDNKGDRVLLFNQTKSFLSFDLITEDEPQEDCFLDGPIEKLNYIRPDTVVNEKAKNFTVDGTVNKQEKLPEIFKEGMEVFHANFGKGIIEKLNIKSNEITINFSSGPQNLVYSKIKNFLAINEPKKTVEANEDCFIGDTINRDQIEYSDTVIHSKYENFVPELKSKKTEKTDEVEIGSYVWHPNFGFGSIESIDSKTNNISIKFLGDLHSFSLSQIKPYLTLVDEPKDIESGIRLKSVIEKKSEFKLEQEFPELSIELEKKFFTLPVKDQFLYLKTVKNLTIEQANDVVATLQGKSPLHSIVKVYKLEQ